MIMKKLTRLQRHTLYILMLDELRTNTEDCFNGDGFCYQLFHIFGFVDSNGGYSNIIEEYLPELLNHKPIELYYDYGLWFPANKYRDEGGREDRMDILKQCIEETY